MTTQDKDQSSLEVEKCLDSFPFNFWSSLYFLALVRAAEILPGSLLKSFAGAISLGEEWCTAEGPCFCTLGSNSFPCH